MNLTSITDEHEVYLKHFYDSITPSFYYDFNQPLTICDVGVCRFSKYSIEDCLP